MRTSTGPQRPQGAGGRASQNRHCRGALQRETAADAQASVSLSVSPHYGSCSHPSLRHNQISSNTRVTAPRPSRHNGSCSHPSLRHNQIMFSPITPSLSNQLKHTSHSTTSIKTYRSGYCPDGLRQGRVIGCQCAYALKAAGSGCLAGRGRRAGNHAPRRGPRLEPSWSLA